MSSQKVGESRPRAGTRKSLCFSDDGNARREKGNRIKTPT